MKKQKNNSGKVFITVTFLATLLIMDSCKQSGTSTAAMSVPQNAVQLPKMNIHTAVITGNMEVLKQYIAARADLNEKEPLGGSSPLISACLFGKTEMARALIDAGAILNFKNNDGSTALHTASFFCRPQIVRMLLDKGADKTKKNKYGSTAYESVAGMFTDVKKIYEDLGKMLAPMGLKLDFAYIEKTRPVIAAMLK